MNKIVVFYDIEGHPVFQVLVRNVKKYTRQNIIFELVEDYIKNNIGEIDLKDEEIYSSVSWKVWTISDAAIYNTLFDLRLDYNKLIESEEENTDNKECVKELFCMGKGCKWMETVLLLRQNKIDSSQYNILTINNYTYVKTWTEQCKKILLANNYSKVFKFNEIMKDCDNNLIGDICFKYNNREYNHKFTFNIKKDKLVNIDCEYKIPFLRYVFNDIEKFLIRYSENISNLK
ncbi:hypothetical protein [Clostridioides sp. ZZV14-6345]|uniref:hypothetical protein n=1 Tax=Clostridioides sp. ZZV14-6345 TaxID=2811496 RepID=UPI001D1247D3|nr:hypothetical protein [Clostridioides sp. ZZV14-6345]